MRTNLLLLLLLGIQLEFHPLLSVNRLLATSRVMSLRRSKAHRNAIVSYSGDWSSMFLPGRRISSRDITTNRSMENVCSSVGLLSGFLLNPHFDFGQSEGEWGPKQRVYWTCFKSDL
jgi:hypothetical protein